MTRSAGAELYTIRAAAKRIKRSRVTVQKWVREGLPYQSFPGDHGKYIRLDDLQAALRTRIISTRTKARGLDGRFVERPVR